MEEGSPGDDAGGTDGNAGLPDAAGDAGKPADARASEDAGKPVDARAPEDASAPGDAHAAGDVGVGMSDGGSEGSATQPDAGGAGQVLYSTCTVLGGLDCSLADPQIRLLCDGMTWNPIGVCVGQQVCDTSPGPNHGLCTGADAAAPSDPDAQASPVNDAGSAGVALYTPCPGLGALECSSADPKIQVLCDGMLWSPIGTCTGSLVCDPLPGPDQGQCKAP